MKRTSTLIAAITLALIATPTLAEQKDTPLVEAQELDQQPTGSIEPCKRVGLFGSRCDNTTATEKSTYPTAPVMPQFGI